MIRAALAILAVGLISAGCTGTPVGRICDLGGATPATSEVVVTSPSLDCVSRTCLRYPLSRDLPPGGKYNEKVGLCTAECTSADDCERVPESPCTTGFTCGIAVTVGPFCCRKFCICKDYAVVPDNNQLPTPLACIAGTQANTCCNLPGRVGDATNYPLCNITSN